MWPFKKQAKPLTDFSNIGFSMDKGVEGFKKIMSLAALKGTWLENPRGFYVRLASQSGAELWAQADKNKDLMGGHPFFNGRSEVKLLHKPYFANRYSLLDGSCYTMLKDGNISFPIFIDIVNYFERSEPKENDRITVKVSGFAKKDFNIYDSYEKYCEVEKGGQLAQEAFIPSGTFDPHRNDVEPTAHAIIAGTILDIKQLQNEFTEEIFYWLYVKSLGSNFDIVVAPELIKTIPKIGGYIVGVFWLSGIIVNSENGNT